MKNKFNEQCITEGQAALIFNSRIFWRRFTTWVRVYIISRYLGVGTAEESFGRLYLESNAIGNMIELNFGLESSRRYSQLINQFTIILRDLISAQLEGNAEAVQENVNRLYQNADERASYLASINPYFNQTEWKHLLEQYLYYTIEEANSFVSGNYSRDIEFFDRLTDLSNRMGDVFAQGLYDYVTGFPGTAPFQPQDTRKCFTYDQVNAIYEIMMLWFELVTWTRFYMLSRYLGIGNREEVYARFKQVPVNYANGIKEIFGEQNAEKSLQLMNTYIELIDAFITAQIDGNVDEINRVTQLLYQNADERAELLASMNPFWDQSDWKARLYNINSSTIAESSSFLTKSYAINLDIFNTLLDLADSNGYYLAQGIYDFLEQQGNLSES